MFHTWDVLVGCLDDPDLFRLSYDAVLSHSACPTLSDTWTVTCQDLLSMEILQARILQWVVMPSSRGSSLSRDQTQVFHIAGGFLTD